MKKPWSITTTIRNPDRIKNLVTVASSLEGKTWDDSTQVLFQILLIKERLYGFGNAQFYNGLPSDLVGDYDDINKPVSLNFATKLFNLTICCPSDEGKTINESVKKIWFC